MLLFTKETPSAGERKGNQLKNIEILLEGNSSCCDHRMTPKKPVFLGESGQCVPFLFRLSKYSLLPNHGGQYVSQERSPYAENYNNRLKSKKDQKNLKSQQRFPY